MEIFFVQFIFLFISLKGYDHVKMKLNGNELRYVARLVADNTALLGREKVRKSKKKFL